MPKRPAVLHLSLHDNWCLKFHNLSFRTRNLKVEDFLERWFSYLQVFFRSRSGLKAARLLKRMISKTGQIRRILASTVSSRFERVSCVEIEPNELYAYAKNVETLNKLTLGILEKFARVSFRFGGWKNLQHLQNTSIWIEINPDFHHPSSIINQAIHT